MPVYTFKETQFIPTTLDVLWDFISSPQNLKKITPPSMGFDVITSDLPEKMYAGMIIAYHVRPLFGIKTTWVTEITHVNELKYFVDEQRFGPYTMWHHQHLIEPVEGGILMTDIIDYQPPMGFIGAIANKLVIRKTLKEIFAFRKIKLEAYFGKP
ncbi:MAG: SRPBCC family protein [Mariniphaga sp.]